MVFDILLSLEPESGQFSPVHVYSLGRKKFVKDIKILALLKYPLRTDMDTVQVFTHPSSDDMEDPGWEPLGPSEYTLRPGDEANELRIEVPGRRRVRSIAIRVITRGYEGLQEEIVATANAGSGGKYGKASGSTMVELMVIAMIIQALPGTHEVYSVKTGSERVSTQRLDGLTGYTYTSPNTDEDFFYTWEEVDGGTPLISNESTLTSFLDNSNYVAFLKTNGLEDVVGAYHRDYMRNPDMSTIPTAPGAGASDAEYDLWKKEIGDWYASYFDHHEVAFQHRDGRVTVWDWSVYNDKFSSWLKSMGIDMKDFLVFHESLANYFVASEMKARGIGRF